ncbi:nucleotidyltransferase family protein [Geminicoccus flavidas]|uniref:nucleotidyltransferase family protein n=1 Tax=Geminicoccus flavidas TaxID=2506407 RepID=UPI00190F13E8|nr:DNA polymerase III subunit beta [Geminicoccus flavidas]
MHPTVAARLPEIRALCRKYGARRLELFGSAARDDFDPARSDVGLLVDYLPDYGGARPLVAYFQLLFDLERYSGARSTSRSAGRCATPGS